jgi:hypothetical protein
MGRPLNKKHFGSNAAPQIGVTANVGSGEGAGEIIKQTGTNRYQVKVGANTGTCVVVDKDLGTLAAGEMVIQVTTTGGTARAKNIKGHTLVLTTGERMGWDYASPTAGKAQMIDEIVPDILIATQPVNATVTAPATATFTVSATNDASATMTYQWQVRQGSGSYANVSTGTGGTTASYTTAATVVGMSGYTYRVIVSATGGDPVTSTAATLTVNA